MSARKRRDKRKIARLVRMDATLDTLWFRRHHRPMVERHTTHRRIFSDMQALGRALERKGLKASALAAITTARRERGQP